MEKCNLSITLEGKHRFTLAEIEENVNFTSLFIVVFNKKTENATVGFTGAFAWQLQNGSNMVWPASKGM